MNTVIYFFRTNITDLNGASSSTQLLSALQNLENKYVSDVNKNVIIPSSFKTPITLGFTDGGVFKKIVSYSVTEQNDTNSIDFTLSIDPSRVTQSRNVIISFFWRFRPVESPNLKNVFLKAQNQLARDINSILDKLNKGPSNGGNNQPPSNGENNQPPSNGGK